MRKSKIKSISYAKWGYVFVASFFIVYFLFTFIPQIMTIFDSFFDYADLAGTLETDAKFCGFKNYVSLFRKNDRGEIEILRDLRLGKYDCLVGINLLREGLDLPEVSLVCILDADKQGFLRSERSLIQTIGRAARNQNGLVIMYADSISESMDVAIKETNRRREIQEAYNKAHGIVPHTIVKEIRDSIKLSQKIKDGQKVSKEELKRSIDDLEHEMREAAKRLDFERAAELRDIIIELKTSKGVR